jgi:hypothetical protein
LLNEVANNFTESEKRIADITITFVLPSAMEGLRQEQAILTRRRDDATNRFAAANIGFEDWTKSKSHILLQASQRAETTKLTPLLLSSLEDIGVKQR